MTRYRLILLFVAMMVSMNVIAQQQCDTLSDRRVKMYIHDGDAMIPAEGNIVPKPLKKGDLIAIVTPASDAPHYNYDNIVNIIESLGYRAYVAPHAAGRHGTYSGTVKQRYSDLSEALTNPEVRAIICSRGGYGAVHLLEDLDMLQLDKDPKWIVGFSDISALHALMNSHGVASLHGPMGCNIKLHDGELSESCKAMFDLLAGRHVTYEIDSNRLNRHGEVSGKLVGGNLAVIAGLISTPFDVIKPGSVLYIEDVAEPIYKVERQLYQLKLSGVLESLAGLIVGDFTETSGDANYHSMEAMIADMVKDYDYPVAFGVPAGHARVNIPLVLGAPVMLEVGEDGTFISQ